MMTNTIVESKRKKIFMSSFFRVPIGFVFCTCPFYNIYSNQLEISLRSFDPCAQFYTIIIII